MPDYSELIALRASGGPSEAETAEIRRMGRFVAVKLHDMERSDEWAVFTRHVEALRDAVDARIAEIRTRMEDAVGGAHTRLRLALKEVQGARAAYDEVLRIPALIRDQVSRETPPAGSGIGGSL